MTNVFNGVLSNGFGLWYVRTGQDREIGQGNCDLAMGAVFWVD